MRNTARFLLGNLAGFDPARDLLASERLVELDRWAIERTRELQSEVVAAYRDYTFHLIYQKVHNFCVVDLGGFYLDVIKDRLYTTRTDSEPRRSAQTALYWIAEGLTRWLAPILSFTAEEIWRYMPGERTESVFHTTWVELPATGRGRVAVDWPAVLEVRSVVLRELERLRIEGRIGAPLDAVVDLYCAPERRAALAVLGDELRFLLITSEARLHAAEDRPAAASAGGGEGEGAFWVSVDASGAAKCVRCWHKREDVGHSDRHPQLCARCVTNIEGPGEQRRFA